MSSEQRGRSRSRSPARPTLKDAVKNPIVNHTQQPDLRRAEPTTELGKKRQRIAKAWRCNQSVNQIAYLEDCSPSTVYATINWLLENPGTYDTVNDGRRGSDSDETEKSSGRKNDLEDR